MTASHENPENIPDDMAEYLPTFLDETEEQLDDLVETLLRMESDSKNQEALNESFRLIHSIKGSAGIMGFENITVLTHHLENRFDQFRAGKAKLDEATMNLVLRCIDFLRHCNNELRAGRQLGSSAKLLQELKLLEEKPAEPDASIPESGLPNPAARNVSVTDSHSTEQVFDSSFGQPASDKPLIRMTIQFRNRLQLIDLKAQLIASRLSALGDIKLTQPDLTQLPNIKQLQQFEIHLETDEELSDLRDAADVEGVESIEFANTAPGSAFKVAPIPRHLETETGNPAIHQNTQESEASPNHHLAVTPLVEGTHLDDATEENESKPPVSSATTSLRPADPQPEVPGSTTSKISETMRVEIDRLDKLLNLAGELVVNRARFEQVSAELDPELRKTNMLNQDPRFWR